jgi:hypothetical protein
MEHEPQQLDLFTDAVGEGAAQIATQAAGKQTLPTPAPVLHSLVLRFPVAVWAPRLWQPKVTKVARLLQERKTERGRENLWRSTVQSLFAQMQRRGATGEEIEVQIASFHTAVSWQLSDQQSGPGAA